MIADKSKKIRLKCSIIYYIYFIILNILYSNFITIRFEYEGFKSDLNLQNFTIASFFIVLFTPILWAKNKPSNIFISIVLLVTIVPSFVLYVGSSLPLKFILVTLLGFLIVIITSKIISIKPLNLPMFSGLVVPKLAIYLAIIFLISIYSINGLEFINFDLSLIYDIRRDAAKNLPDIIIYFNLILTQSLIPLGIVFSIFYKKYNITILYFLFSILIFAFTSHKGPLLYPLISYFLYKINDDKIIYKIYIAIIFLVILSLLDEWILFNDNDILFSGWFTSIFLVRALLIPSYLNWIYIDFFDFSQLNFWSDSKISLGLYSPIYSLPIPEIIGSSMGGDSNANTGWIGSGFSQAGLIGVVVYSFFIGALLSYIDGISKIWGNKITTAVFFMPIIIIFTSADFVTALISHGILSSIFIFSFMKYPINQKV